MMKYLSVTFLLMPLLVSAAVPSDAFEVVGLIASWITRTIPLLLGFILLVIFWNLSQFVLHAGDEKEREKYKQFIVWSVVAMTLIVSFWGIMNAITVSFFGDMDNPMLWNPGYVDKNGNAI